MVHDLQLVARPDGPNVKIGPTFPTDFTWDRNGGLLDRSVKASWEVKLVGETKLEGAYERVFELFDDVPFDVYQTKLSLESEWLKWLAWSVSYKQGTDVNHKPPSGVAPFVAGAGKGEFTLTFPPPPRLRLDPTHLYSPLPTPPRVAPARGPPARGFPAPPVREKLHHQVSPALAPRAL